jgi:hypothetical protein
MSDDTPQMPIQVGDEIAFRSDHFSRSWTVYKVEKVTKSGRIKAGHYEMNSDLSIRGRSGWGGPFRGVFVTPELRKVIVAERRKNAIVARVSEVRWLNISLAKLEKIDAILQEADE